jgi:hypothetical protein
MRIVVIESPYRSYSAFELQRNLAYARALVEHVTLRGDAPVASHLLITQSLDDRILEHRQKGIMASNSSALPTCIHSASTLESPPAWQTRCVLRESAKCRLKRSRCLSGTRPLTFPDAVVMDG